MKNAIITLGIILIGVVYFNYNCIRVPPDHYDHPDRLMPGTPSVQDVSLRWDPPASGTDPTGYMIAWGTTPGNYPETLDVGNVLHHQVTLPDHRVFLAVCAYNDHGVSDPSNMITNPPIQITDIERISIVRFTWDSILGESYILESSEDLLSWDLMRSGIPGESGSTIFDIPYRSHTKFYRIKLE